MATVCGEADDLPPAGVAGSVFFNIQPPAGISVFDFGTYPLTGPGGFIQFAASGSPSPSLSAEMTIESGFTGRASGILQYSMQILGPDGTVPVLAAAAGSVAGFSTTSVPFAGFAMKALWRIEDVNQGLALVYGEGIETPALQGSFSDSFSHSVQLDLVANHIYRVTLTADAFAGTGGIDVPASASAFIDPTFSFGPGVDPGYSLQFSEGIGNTPIPEVHTAPWVGTILAASTLFRRARRPNPSTGLQT